MDPLRMRRMKTIAGSVTALFCRTVFRQSCSGTLSLQPGRGTTRAAHARCRARLRRTALTRRPASSKRLQPSLLIGDDVEAGSDQQKVRGATRRIGHAKELHHGLVRRPRPPR